MNKLSNFWATFGCANHYVEQVNFRLSNALILISLYTLIQDGSEHIYIYIYIYISLCLCVCMCVCVCVCVREKKIKLHLIRFFFWSLQMPPRFAEVIQKIWGSNFIAYADVKNSRLYLIE